MDGNDPAGPGGEPSEDGVPNQPQHTPQEIARWIGVIKPEAVFYYQPTALGFEMHFPNGQIFNVVVGEILRNPKQRAIETRIANMKKEK